jgi:hypothetical protein
MSAKRKRNVRKKKEKKLMSRYKFRRGICPTKKKKKWR